MQFYDNNMDLDTLEFEPLVINGRTVYRSTRTYVNDANKHCIAWPYDERQGKINKIGVCQSLPGNELGRTWLWNLDNRELEISGYDPPYRVYPDPETWPNFIVPQIFFMVLDAGLGMLTFGLDKCIPGADFWGNLLDIGVAFEDLVGNEFYVIYSEDEAVYYY